MGTAWNRWEMDQWRGVEDINSGGTNNLWNDYELSRRARDPEDVHPSDGQLQALQTFFAKALHRHQQHRQEVIIDSQPESGEGRQLKVAAADARSAHPP